LVIRVIQIKIGSIPRDLKINKKEAWDSLGKSINYYWDVGDSGKFVESPDGSLKISALRYTTSCNIPSAPISKLASARWQGHLGDFF
jgi:hypothetical protein